MKINRLICPEIEKELENEKILILKGARQTGKTTILKSLEKKLKSEKKETVFLSADDLSRQDLFENPSVLVDFLGVKYQFPKKKIYLFLDEFQYIKNAGVFVKNLYDQHGDKLKIICSGSSSLEITKNTEFLTGRHVPFSVSRISFLELFSFREGKSFSKFQLDKWSDLKKFYSAYRRELERYFREFLKFGSYPGIIMKETEEEKTRELEVLVKTYLEKDIIYLLRVGNIRTFQDILRVFCSRPGSLLNVKELSSTLSASQDTIKKYLNILEGTYIISRLAPFFTNVRKSISKMQKVFILDMGIINFINRDLENFEQIIDLGGLVENFVFLELKGKDKDLYFYRTIAGSEIDFIIDKKALSLVEVKYRAKVNKRNLAFENFTKDVDAKRKIIVTKDYLAKEGGIYFIPACLFAFVEI